FMTKELAEVLRRTGRDNVAGILHFSYLTWFIKPWSVDNIKPLPAYYALKTALQPVLVSAELYGRHFYAGRSIQCRVCVVNDFENYEALPVSLLIWEIADGTNVLKHGEIHVPKVGYYENHWLNAKFTLPENLPAPRLDAHLNLRLEANGKILSQNSYDIVVATSSWAKNKVGKISNVTLLDLSGKLPGALSAIPYSKETSMKAINPGTLLIISGAKEFESNPMELEKLRRFISQGGHALLLHPGDALIKMFPDDVKAFTAKKGEIVTMHRPESPVFSGIEPLDLSWFQRGERQIPIACTGTYRITENTTNVFPLADQCDIHGYLQEPSDVVKISGTPLLEIRIGKGKLIASEFHLESKDPIAQRLLTNIIHYLE
ncbi:MAG: hypothetical protein ACREFE_19625, partial [Limisphaerales bacterium]